ncbi:NADH dehydrogenase, alpha subcomplex, subunit 6 [Daldinia vernicosa]|uniref:NADH dehydrogenase, alpha subcomplex, subunit 6 n=1 Tax=Daldinia vernicosa TaxID=114800 RepID=UPI0020081BB7|nr:NADH dehydrogenase, alpha subcomplex, subunit 6 [Daldinia vernicosa]KAI0847874.1 NADH dehydrogenase, alpha subcomplex, subunit 6 [Daldinia vernicosa]
MPVTPTQFARTTRTSANWSDARRRVLAAYREWIRAAPEIQTMYSIPFPVSVIRTRMRQEFERHRFVDKLPVVDVLLVQNNAEYQETMNFWKQTTHVMSYFPSEHFRGADRLPKSFMQGFLEATRPEVKS